jgi:mono/diheme cytochrome c family protein
MNFGIVIVVAVMAALRLLVKPSMLVWLAAWWLSVFCVLRFGFLVPIPVSVVKVYMGITSGSLAAYILADRQRFREVVDPLTSFMTESRHQVALAVVALLIPAAFAYQTWAGMTAAPSSPNFPRTVHPAAPVSITVHDAEIDLVSGDNPYRELESSDPETFAAYVTEGKRVYYENCFYCHGDTLAADGMFAHGLNPIPSNFQDPNVLPNFTESFFFWRIAKGAPGLPEEGGPWDSAMPAWESFLTNDEIWKVILFLYNQAGSDDGYRPRALAEEH